MSLTKSSSIPGVAWRILTRSLLHQRLSPIFNKWSDGNLNRFFFTILNIYKSATEIRPCYWISLENVTKHQDSTPQTLPQTYLSSSWTSKLKTSPHAMQRILIWKYDKHQHQTQVWPGWVIVLNFRMSEVM